ncbi:hypothetical protein POX_h09506 [Penicillium oxalicum]|uniref:Rhodopsin domain-containing protein n=1 Tax=Penicillium oxalicum (strain 114-2 / CGMCC 5302) TaxID=933388 RepID=S8B8X1_PENO1|nr:hypothetical protein POX_h09506 [Penicillium oxalicum]EPS31207.1 hypothetical protein PDE_06162 [Penicillium oxalicum 114-2]KAI2785747.1 hypothetical protein POX_h09506 [Penicillium oxalicum]
MIPPLPLTGGSMAIVVVGLVMLILALIAVSLRIFVRVHVVRAFGWDDGIMLFALVFFIVFITCSIVGSFYGGGRSTSDYPSAAYYRISLLYWWLCEVFYTWSSALAKLSIAVALLRLTIDRVHRTIIFLVMGVTIAVSLMFWIALLLNCRPVSYFWDSANPTKTGTCMSLHELAMIVYVYSSFTIVCDLTLSILPIFLVWKLQMSPRTKVAVVVILSMGGIASIAVIIRIPYLHLHADTSLLRSTYSIAIWSVVETALGIIASSLFTLRPLFRWLLDEKFSSGRATRSNPPGASSTYPLGTLDRDGLKATRNTVPTTRTPKQFGQISEHSISENSVMTIPASREFIMLNNSEEAIHSEAGLMASQGGRITVQRTFMQSVSERAK